MLRPSLDSLYLNFKRCKFSRDAVDLLGSDVTSASLPILPQ